jgi:hypothetical protein
MRAGYCALLTPTLPGSHTRAVWTLALFAAIQLADATMTVAGVAQFGVGIEGNPVLSFYATTLGIGVAVVSAKLFCIAAGVLLHLRAKHLALAILTLGYVLGAVIPWMWVLTP